MDKIITVNANLDVPLDSAFSYFSENTLLEKWLTVKARVEMKVGGRFELFWTPEDTDLTNNSSYGCKVLAVERPYYFNVEWMGNAEQKKFMNTVHPLTNVTVIFHERSPGKTKVVLLHTGWREGDNWESARQFFIQAWQGAFKKLEGIVNEE